MGSTTFCPPSTHESAASPHLAPVSRAIECVEAALSDIRRTVSALRAPTVAESGVAGIVEDLVVGHEARTGSTVRLTIDGQLPTKDSVIKNTYPYARPTFYYTNGAPAGEAARFVEFTLSEEGRRITEKVGFVAPQ